MQKSLRSIRGAVLLGLAWAVVWAAVAVLIGGVIIDPDGSMEEMWPAAGAYPGFLCAVVFSVIVGIAERGHAFDELSLSRAAAWGGAAGLLIGALPFVIGTPTSEIALWQLVGLVLGSITIMSALSGIGTVLVSQYARRKRATGRARTTA